MIRVARAAAVPLLLAVAACGTQRADGRGTAAGGPPSSQSQGAPSRSASPPARPALEARARSLESALELIYATDVPGFALAEQSVAPFGNDGFQSVYVAASGGRIHLVVDRGGLTGANCPSEQVDSADGAAVRCEHEGDAMWYRTAGGRHEYARAADGHVVRLAADRSAVDRPTLRAAAVSAHRADDRELDAILPEERSVPTAPVERGDLPPVGDGAPNNDVGAGG